MKSSIFVPMESAKRTKYVVITGAASGIGREFARNYAQSGYQLVLIDKNALMLGETAEHLRDAYKVEVNELAKDLSLRESAQEIYNYTIENSLPIFGLINNAGFGLFGKFSETNLDTELTMVDLHVTTPITLTKLFLPQMLERNEGEIMNVSSLAGFQPGPMMSVYYSTKAFLISFTEAIAREHKESNVKISVLCPGVTKTNFKQTVCNNSQAKINSLDSCPEKVVEYGVKSLRKGKVVIIPTMICKMLSLLPRFLPRNTARNVVYKIQMKNRGN